MRTSPTSYAVFVNDRSAAFAMVYVCHCGKSALGFGSDARGLFTGVCVDGHTGSVPAS